MDDIDSGFVDETMREFLLVEGEPTAPVSAPVDRHDDDFPASVSACQSAAPGPNRIMRLGSITQSRPIISADEVRGMPLVVEPRRKQIGP